MTVNLYFLSLSHSLFGGKWKNLVTREEEVKSERQGDDSVLVASIGESGRRKAGNCGKGEDYQMRTSGR